MFELFNNIFTSSCELIIVAILVACLLVGVVCVVGMISVILSMVTYVIHYGINSTVKPMKPQPKFERHVLVLFIILSILTVFGTVNNLVLYDHTNPKSIIYVTPHDEKKPCDEVNK